MHTNFCSENLKEEDHLGNLGVNGRIILKRIVRKRRETSQ
jgi:hypothetical protein